MTDLDERPASRVAGVSRRAAPAVLAVAAVRALSVAVLAVWSAAADRSPHQLLAARWDSLWYTRVAEHGYGWQVTLPDGSVHSNLAFFPLLPWLERFGSAVAPLSYADAGLAVSWTASLFAACGIFAVTDRLYGRRAGICAALLWAVLPVGIVQSMAYSESLFTALAAWSLYALLADRWVTAGVLASLAGLTRPVGVAVVAAVWVTAAVRLAAERRAAAERAPGGQSTTAASVPRQWPARIPSSARRPPAGPAAGRARHRADGAMVLGVLLAPLGAAGYVLWVGHRTGRGILGYLDVQEQWGNGFDGGLAFARFIGGRLGPSSSVSSLFAGLGLIAAVALVLWLYALCVRTRQPVPLLVYGGVVMVLALCAEGYFGSKPRLLMPAFPLLLPPAVALARLRASRSALVLGCVAVASAGYGAFWLHGSGPP